MDKKRNKIFFILKGLSLVFVIFLIFLGVLFIYYAKDLPRPEKFTERPFVLPTKIYDREGKVLLYQIYGEEKRTIISLNQVPEYLKQAVIVAEDANFYHHFGLDIKGILRAIIKDVKLGKPIYGGSTISQQLIRSSFLTREKTLRRKMKEIILTLELERRYSKDQILEFYLNQVPFGPNAYGVKTTAQIYFKKPPPKLTLAESALLASLIRAPSYLSPLGPNKKKLMVRKNYILDRMVQEGYLEPGEAEKAKNQTLKFSEIGQPIKAPHFALYVKHYLKKNYPDYFLKSKGLKVYTSLDWELQKIAEKVVTEGVKINQNYKAHNAALVAIDPNTGQILAMVGSANWYSTSSYPEGCSIEGQNCLFDPKVNVAVYGKGRQPGSAFKPFAYAVAFKKGFSPNTRLWDLKTEFNPDCHPNGTHIKDQYGLDCYHPKNYDRRFRGLVTLRQALAQSINLPSVKVLYLAGIKKTIDLAKTMGITTLNQPLPWYGLSLVLGGGEVKLLDMVSAYGVFATEGLKAEPVKILKIEDAQGNIIEQNQKTPKRVLETRITRLINDILSDNEARTPMFGSRSALYIDGYKMAAKTGTTQNYRDAWTIGYAPNLVAGVWAGNNDNSPMAKKPGVMLSSPIWHNFMEKALEKFPKQDFIKPEIKKGYPSTTSTHSILYSLNQNDPQYLNWEWACQNYLD